MSGMHAVQVPGTRVGHPPFPVQNNVESLYQQLVALLKQKYFNHQQKRVFPNINYAFVISEWSRNPCFDCTSFQNTSRTNIFYLSAQSFLPSGPCPKCLSVRHRGHTLIIKESDSMVVDSSSWATAESV